jgi:predicted nucleotidyltransferase
MDTSIELQQRIRDLLERRPEILDAYLFGSTARGVASPLADVALLHRLLNHHLGDFEEFSRHVDAFLARS